MTRDRLAIEMGADAIEPDLVRTKDGILIARHEHELGDTTDVAETFPEGVIATTRRKDPLVPVPADMSAARPHLVPQSRKRRTSSEARETVDAMTITEHIRVRAYYLSLERGGFTTDPVGDWLRAERELTEGAARATPNG